MQSERVTQADMDAAVVLLRRFGAKQAVDNIEAASLAFATHRLAHSQPDTQEG